MAQGVGSGFAKPTTDPNPLNCRPHAVASWLFLPGVRWALITQQRGEAVTYVSEWKPIASVLAHVMAMGLAKDAAKLQLCAAITDGKVGVRLILAADARRGLPQQTVGYPELTIPPRLTPEDIDWTDSVQLIEWPPVTPRSGEPISLLGVRAGHLLDRGISLIEIRVADATRLFGPATNPAPAVLPSGQPWPRSLGVQGHRRFRRQSTNSGQTGSRLTAQEVIIRNLVHSAARGDIRATHALFALRARYQESAETTLMPSDLEAGDRRIIEDYLAKIFASGIAEVPQPPSVETRQSTDGAEVEPAD